MEPLGKPPTVVRPEVHGGSGLDPADQMKMVFLILRYVLSGNNLFDKHLGLLMFIVQAEFRRFVMLARRPRQG